MRVSRELHFNSDKRLVTTVLVLQLIPILWFLGYDFFLFANDWPRLRARLLIRAVSVATPLTALWWVRRIKTRDGLSQAVFVVAVTICGIQLALNMLRPEGSILPVRTTFMFLIVLYGALPNTFGRQVLPPALFSAGIILERLFWLTSDAEGDLAGDIVITLFVNVVGIIVVMRRLELEREVDTRFEAERAALAEAEHAMAELKTLRGIIPVCAWCRKARTEAGEWQLLERYVAEHSEAEFSHGICPECREAQFLKPQS